LSFTNADLGASLSYLIRIGSDVDHGDLDWHGVRFVVCELMFGGGIVNNHDRRVIRALGDVLLNPAVLAAGGDKELDFKLCDGVSLGWLGLEHQQLHSRNRTPALDCTYAVPADAAAGSYQALVRYAGSALPDTDTPAVWTEVMLCGLANTCDICCCWN
jgi:hypothetical protein